MVLGFVLQTQIALRLLQAKQDDALARRSRRARSLLERELAGVDPNREGAQGELNNALDRLTNASVADDPRPPAAGEFRAVLTTPRRGRRQRRRGPRRGRPVGPAADASPTGTLSCKYGPSTSRASTSRR